MTITPGLDLAAFCREHRVRFVRKDHSRLMRFLSWLFGLVGYDFMRRAWTTVGRTVYYPVTIYAKDPERLGHLPVSLSEHRPIIEHEFYHVLQYERLWHLHSLLYLVFPLPVGLAWYRWRCERVAYLHKLRHYMATGPMDGPVDAVQDERARQRRVETDRVVNKLWRVYGWCWPRWAMRRWFGRMPCAGYEKREDDRC
jgi:hypothetical protein